MKNPIRVEVSRNGPKKRYEIDFFKDGIQWAVYLEDQVYDNPTIFSNWMRSLIENIQLRS